MDKLAQHLKEAEKFDPRMDKDIINIIKSTLGIKDKDIESKQVYSTGRTYYLDASKEIRDKKRMVQQKIQKKYKNWKVHVEFDLYRGTIDLEPK